jgi:nucleoside-diphosphate-sugar epimerase
MNPCAENSKFLENRLSKLSFQNILKNMNTPRRVTVELHAVTGAFGYSGRHIANRLLKEGHRVITLTSSSDRRSPPNGRVASYPLDFGQPDQLATSLAGVAVLYNTYWVRFNHRRFGHPSAVENSRVLFEAARSAGVRRIVHISITNPSLDSPLSYFRGKAKVERALEASGIPHAILRPAVLFGGDDILINNIAWALRHLPVFGVFGDGSYRLRPIHVDDLAAAAVALGARDESTVVNAVGPDSLSYHGLIETIAQSIGVYRPIIRVPKGIGWIAGKIIGWAHRDVTITMDEIHGLMAGLLDVDSEPLGSTSIVDWLHDHHDQIGMRYANEMSRRR